MSLRSPAASARLGGGGRSLHPGLAYATSTARRRRTRSAAASPVDAASQQSPVPQQKTPASTTLLGLLVALIPATAGTERGFVVPFLRVSELLVLVVLLLALSGRRGGFAIAPRAGAALFVYTAIYTVFSVTNALRRGGVSHLELVEDSFGAWQYLLLFIAVVNLSRLPGFFRSFVAMSVLFATVHAAVGLLQMADVQAALDLATRVTGNELIAARPDWKAPRSVGLFRSWHAYGAYLALTAVLGLAHLLRERERGGSRTPLVPLQLVIIGLGLLASLTFAPILIGAVGVLVLVRRQRVAAYLAGGALLVAVLVTLTPLEEGFGRRISAQLVSSGTGLLPQTIWFRLQVWSDSWLPLIQENLLLGYGRPGEVAGAFAYAESMYILTLLIGGLPLLIAFLLVLRTFWRVSAPTGLEDGTGPARSTLRATLPMLALGMLIHPYLADAGISQLVYVLAAICAAGAASPSPGSSRTA